MGFIGAGKVASALVRGFVLGRAVGATSNVLASCLLQEKHLLEDFDRSVTDDVTGKTQSMKLGF